MNRTIIKGGSLIESGVVRKADILMQDGFILKIGENLPENGADAIDASGCIVCSGLVDVHVHFREPGYESKETIRTGSLSAARGGYTAVCAMPNLNPTPDSSANIAIEQNIIDRDAVVDVLPYASITKGRAGKELVDMASLKDKCIAFSDDGSGVQSDGMMLAAMTEAAKLDCLIAAHCEDTSYADPAEMEWRQIERDIELAARTGCRYHVCHISTRKSVDLIRAAKARGVKITCETAPHYLTLCDADLSDDGRFKMNPPIHTADDREALIEALADGTVDMIATDHAPHTAEEKSRGFAGSLNGILGLETAFPVLYTNLVMSGIISLPRLVEAMSDAPRRVFRIGGALKEGEKADIAVIDTTTEFTIRSADFLSKGRSTPFEDWKVRGMVKATFKNGKVIYNI